jgi:hypothetical protein
VISFIKLISKFWLLMMFLIQMVLPAYHDGQGFCNWISGEDCVLVLEES